MSFPKLRFSFPKRRRLVYIGVAGNSLLRTYIAETDFVVYRSVREECNVWVGLKAFLTGRWSARGYYQTFLAIVQPSYVITYEDNALEFYLTKVYQSSCKTLCVQNGRRDNYSHHPSKNIWSLISDSVAVARGPDVIATHGEPWSTYYRNALRNAPASVFSIGSVKNNALRIATRRSRGRLLYISSFPNLGAAGVLEERATEIFGYWQGTPVTFAEFYRLEGILARRCAEIAQSRGLEFGVLGKRPSWQKGEYAYFADSLNGFEWIYQASETEASSYEAVANNDFLVNIDSTFGYEMFARGLRVAFVSARMQYSGLHHIRDCQFGYPLLTQLTGSFWTDSATDQEIARVINYVIDVSDPEWDSASRRLREIVMPFDFGNSQLCTLLTSLGIETYGPGEWSTGNTAKS